MVSYAQVSPDRGIVMKRTILFFVIIFFIFITPIFSQTDHYQLTNGMTLLLSESKETNLIGMSIVVYGGTQYEKKEEKGTYRLLTEILQRGTKNRTKDEIIKEISLIGDSFEAYTRTEYWGISATVPQDSLKELLELSHDLLVNPLSPVEELKKVKNIAIQSIKSSKDLPWSNMSELYRSVFYPDFYIKREERIKHIQDIERNTLLKTYHQFFTPENMIISISGNFETDRTLNLVKDIFGTIPQCGISFEKRLIAQKKDNLPLHKEKRGGVTQAGILIGTRLYDFDRSNEHIIMVLNAVLDNSIGGRLFEEVIEKKGLVYSIAPYYSLSIRPYTWFIFSTSRKKNTSSVIKEIEKVLKSLKKNPPSEDELKLAKEYLKTRLAISYQSPSLVARYNAENLLRNQKPKSLSERIKEIEDVSRKDLDLFINTYFPEKWTTLVLR